MQIADWRRKTTPHQLPKSGATHKNDGGARGENQPVSGGVRQQPHLIGQRRAATGAVGGELGLVQLDQVLRLTAGAAEIFIQPPRSAPADARADPEKVEFVIAPTRGSLI